MYFLAMYLDCVDIARRSSARGVKQPWDGKTSLHTHTRLSRAYLALATLYCLKCYNYAL